MLFKFLKADGNDIKSVAQIQSCDKAGLGTSAHAEISVWLLGEACSKLPGFKGFLPGQHFEIEVRPVTVKHADSVSPVTDGADLLSR